MFQTTNQSCSKPPTRRIIGQSFTSLTIPDSNHGAGQFTLPTFKPYLWPSCVGKYSSTMVRIWERFTLDNCRHYWISFEEFGVLLLAMSKCTSLVFCGTLTWLWTFHRWFTLQKMMMLHSYYVEKPESIRFYLFQAHARRWCVWHVWPQFWTCFQGAWLCWWYKLTHHMFTTK